MAELTEAGISCYVFNRNNTVSQVQATKVGEFIVHKGYRGWVVTDPASGVAVVSGFAKQADAKAAAKDLPADVRKAFEDFKASPKYAEVKANYEKLVKAAEGK